MKKTGIIIHAGAGPDSEFVKKNLQAYEDGLAAALECGDKVLRAGGSSVDAVEAAVRCMEDNYIFNAGRGSALNAAGQVQMYASIMDGARMKAGAGCLLTEIKNPISFARAVMNEGSSVFLGGTAALQAAKDMKLELEPPSYFVTDLQVENYLKKRAELSSKGIRYNPAVRGTVGAVALDQNGNLAAGTSTGGTIYSMPGRIGDTSMIGVGTYADNKVCAVSCTGDGEVLITHALAHSIFSTREYLLENMQEVCEHVINKKLKDVKGDMGAIAIDHQGNVGLAFNSERMHRAWKTSDIPLTVKIYR